MAKNTQHIAGFLRIPLYIADMPNFTAAFRFTNWLFFLVLSPQWTRIFYIAARNYASIFGSSPKAFASSSSVGI